MSIDDTYWAASEKEKIAQEISRRIEECWMGYLALGRERLWREMWSLYYGLDTSAVGPHATSQVLSSGSQGEIVDTRVNQIRSIVRQIVILALANRPTFSAQSANDDITSMILTNQASGYLEHAMKSRGLEELISQQAEIACTMAEGFMWLNWDPAAGKKVMGEDGEKYPEGDYVAEVVPPWRVFRPLDVPMRRSPWVAVKTRESKYDLAAKYSGVLSENQDGEVTAEQLEMRRKILSSSSEYDWARGIGVEPILTSGAQPSDMIPVVYFYHRKTPSMPGGRLTIFAGNDCVLYDDQLPYEDIPVARMSHSEMMETSIGYTDIFDTIGLQKSVDALWSLMVSRVGQGSTPNIVVAENSYIQKENLGGYQLLKVPPGQERPYILDLLSLPNEFPELLSLATSLMEQLSGLNSAARGRPDEALGKSAPVGSMVLMQQQVLSFISGFQASIYDSINRTGNILVSFLKSFTDKERVVQILGEDEREHTVTISKDQLDSIDRVYISSGSQVANTPAGRMQIADSLMEKGLVKTPEQYLTLLKSGRFEPTIRFPYSQIMMINQQNEILKKLEGIDKAAVEQALANREDPNSEMILRDILSNVGCGVLITDDHMSAIKEHSGLATSLEVKKDPIRTALILSKVTWHIEMLRTGDPALLQILGQPSLAQMGMEPPQGSPEEPQGAPQEQPPSPTEDQEAAAGEADTGLPPLEGAPRNPTDPMTGEEFSMV